MVSSYVSAFILHGEFMIQFLLDHSIILMFLVVTVAISYSEYKRYLHRTTMTPTEFRSMLRLKFNQVGSELLAKLAVSVVVSIIISIVSFRELWMNDTFHIVFLTNILSKPTWQYIRDLYK